MIFSPIFNSNFQGLYESQTPRGLKASSLVFWLSLSVKKKTKEKATVLCSKGYCLLVYSQYFLVDLAFLLNLLFLRSKSVLEYWNATSTPTLVFIISLLPSALSYGIRYHLAGEEVMSPSLNSGNTPELHTKVEKGFTGDLFSFPLSVLHWRHWNQLIGGPMCLTKEEKLPLCTFSFFPLIWRFVFDRLVTSYFLNHNLFSTALLSHCTSHTLCVENIVVVVFNNSIPFNNHSFKRAAWESLESGGALGGCLEARENEEGNMSRGWEGRAPWGAELKTERRKEG